MDSYYSGKSSQTGCAISSSTYDMIRGLPRVWNDDMLEQFVVQDFGHKAIQSR